MIEEIKELKELLDLGLITSEEFQERKSRLLAANAENPAAAENPARAAAPAATPASAGGASSANAKIPAAPAPVAESPASTAKTDTKPTNESAKSSRQESARKMAPYLLFGAGIIFLLMGLFFPMPGEELTTYHLTDPEYFQIDEYVGGDAYNYIIGACILGGHISGAMTVKAIFVVSGVAFICAGVILLAFLGTAAKKDGDEKTSPEDAAQIKADSNQAGTRNPSNL